MPRRSILFVCDAGPDVGGGHVMRCLTLSAALVERGVEPAFLRSPAGDLILDAFAPPSLRRVDDAEGFSALAIDDYGLAADDHRRLAAGRPTLVIDDLANRPLAADLVLDSGPSRRPDDYSGLVPPHARLLIGPAYAPVRPEFAALRAAALRRRGGSTVRRLLISMGLTDVGAITERVVRRILPGLGEIRVDVVLGGRAPSLPALQALAENDRRITLHIDTSDMAQLTLAADTAIGAGGSTTWERCVLALPTLQVTLADNQREAATAVAAAGAALVTDGLGPAFDEAASRLLSDPTLRSSLSRAAAELCDGQGATRVADAVLAMMD